MLSYQAVGDFKKGLSCFEVCVEQCQSLNLLVIDAK